MSPDGLHMHASGLCLSDSSIAWPSASPRPRIIERPFVHVVQVPGVPPPEDGHPAVLGPDGKWHYHTGAWWAKQA